MFNYFEVCLALNFWFFLVGYQLPLIFKLTWKWNICNFGKLFRSIFRTLSNIQDGGFYKNSEQLFAFDYFYKELHLRCLTRFEQASSPSNDLRKKLHLRCLAWSWIHLSIIFTRLLPICLLNLINIFHHISSNIVFCAILYCWPLSMDGVQLPQDYRTITRRQFTFYHLVPRNSRYSFDWPRKDKGWVELGAANWFW